MGEFYTSLGQRRRRPDLLARLAGWRGSARLHTSVGVFRRAGSGNGPNPQPRSIGCTLGADAHDPKTGRRRVRITTRDGVIEGEVGSEIPSARGIIDMEF